MGYRWVEFSHFHTSLKVFKKLIKRQTKKGACFEGVLEAVKLCASVKLQW